MRKKQMLKSKPKNPMKKLRFELLCRESDPLWTMNDVISITNDEEPDIEEEEKMSDMIGIGS